MIPVLGVPAIALGHMGRLFESVDYPVADLVVVDNSRDGLDVPPSPWAERRWVLRMPHNLGVAGSWNLVIKSTPFAKWWMFIGVDMWCDPGALERIAGAVPTSGLLTGSGTNQQAWMCLPERTVAQVGLFDEWFHPIYCEDIDYVRRVRAIKGMDVHYLNPDGIHHEFSSTRRFHGFADGHKRTTGNNHRELARKWGTANPPLIGWDLTRRRNMSWDDPR